MTTLLWLGVVMEDKDIQDMLYKKVTREPLPVEVLNGQVVEQMTAKESVPLVLPNNWINKPEEPEIPLVEGLIYKGTLSSFVGSPKTGKSTLARQLAYCVSSGAYFLGREVVKQPVGYLALEEHPSRVRQHFRTLGLKADDLLYIGFDRLRRNKYDLVLQGLREQIQEYRLGLLVVDTARHMPKASGSGGSVLDYNETIDWWQDYLDIAHELNIAVMMVYHMPKGASANPNRNPIDSIFGSTGLSSIVDQSYAVWRNSDDRRSFQSEGRLEDFPDTYLTFNEATLWSELAEPVTGQTKHKSGLEVKIARVWDSLRKYEIESGMNLIGRAELQGRVRMKHADLKEVIDTLVEQRKITIEVGKNGKQTLTFYDLPEETEWQE